MAVSSYDSALKFEPKTFLTFTGIIGSTDVTSFCIITNQSAEVVFLKFKTTRPKSCCAKPNNGCLKPGTSLLIEVRLKISDEERGNAKFMVEWILMKAEDSQEDLHILWKRKRENSEVHCHKLKAFIDQKCSNAEQIGCENTTDGRNTDDLDTSIKNMSMEASKCDSDGESFQRNDSFDKSLYHDVSVSKSVSVVADEFFSCMICLDPADQAVESKCCHKVFCETCANECLNLDCPNCRHFPFLVHPSHIVRRFLDNLSVTCKNVGCSVQLLKSNYNDHQKQCLFAVVNCQNDECNVSITRHELTGHMATCLNSMITCPNKCLTVIQKRELEEHRKVCDYEPVHCTNGNCSMLLPRGQIKKHEEKWCRFMPMQCPAPTCKFAGFGFELSGHISKDHYEIFIQNVHKLFDDNNNH